MPEPSRRRTALVTGATAGLGAGLLTALLTFLSFNFFFLPPYHTLSIHDRLDWLILGTYLITASVAAALLTRAEREAGERIRLAREAEHAEALREIDRLKDAVLAAVSHDLRTPLTSIQALANQIDVAPVKGILRIAGEQTSEHAVDVVPVGP